jgi:LPXTG-motif cell wall-anchored protein
LPKTASSLPLMGLAGLLALAGACGVRAVRRAHA